MKLKYIKTNTDNYQTVRAVLKQEFDLSARLILKLKKSNNIFLNNESVYIDKCISVGDIISVNIDFDEDNSNIIPTKMELDILYEDEYLLIVNKPAGMPVHPSCDHYEDSLSNGVKYHFDIQGLNKKIRPVNRLDKNTSGVVIFAKNEYVQEKLSSQMLNKQFQKEYIAICDGIFDEKSGTISANIKRKNESIIERCVNESGQSAITHYNVLEEKNNISKVQLFLETGRTHQIRVHMAYIGHPIIGDDLYGKPSSLINRQALHAYKVKFAHPITNKQINIIAQLPKDMELFK